MRLQNIVMQLRKISSHPFLFDWPVDEETNSYVVNEDLVNASGKMLLLNRLLDALFDRGHKVLLFSQFTTMLDVIVSRRSRQHTYCLVFFAVLLFHDLHALTIQEDWAVEYKGWEVCRIDGSTSQEDRRSQMDHYNNSTGPDACRLFLLSTRAGGLGINLVSAE